jgi:ADP-ribose pyrophosphatase
MAEERVLSSQSIYNGRAVNLRVDTIQMPDGRETTREVVEHSECVVVVAIDADKKVLLVKQYRLPVQKDLLELPAGGIEGDEEPVDAVRREMQEETGYLPKKIESLGGFYSSPGYCTEYLHLFLATDLMPSQLYDEDTQSITLVRVPVTDIPELIRSGDICDAKSVAGLLIYQDSKKSH